MISFDLDDGDWDLSNLAKEAWKVKLSPALWTRSQAFLFAALQT